MTVRRRFTAAIILCYAASLWLNASATRAADQSAFATAAEAVVARAVVPDYSAFANAAGAQVRSTARLCAATDAGSLAAARADFETLLLAFSRIELYRFGPARKDNRFERLFFWPDRRGRGLKQVQRLIASEDPSALNKTTLRGKSVAVQGMLALEYVLFGKNSEDLANPPAGYRCKFGSAIAGAISDTAAALVRDWTAPDGHAALIRDAGPDNPTYRSHGDVIQDLLKAASEQLQIVNDLKLGRTLGADPGKAKPKAMPFWRSGLGMRATIANIDAVEALFQQGGLKPLAPMLAGELSFELKQVRRALLGDAAGTEDLSVSLSNTDRYEQLAYARIPLAAAIEIISERTPEALGLVLGFNSLDGD